MTGEQVTQSDLAAAASAVAANKPKNELTSQAGEWSAEQAPAAPPPAPNEGGGGDLNVPAAVDVPSEPERGSNEYVLQLLERIDANCAWMKQRFG